MNLEFRADMFNALNTLNLGYRVAARTVTTSTAGRFLDFNQTESVTRTMRMRLRLDSGARTFGHGVASSDGSDVLAR